jgi:hypothetical protein
MEAARIIRPQFICLARARVADGGDGPEIGRLAANILKKQSRTADKRCSSSVGLGDELTTPHRKNRLVTKC